MPSLSELAAFHPCDSCGQRSREAWRHELHDLILTFCGHHSRHNELRLAETGWTLFMVARQEEPA